MDSQQDMLRNGPAMSRHDDLEVERIQKLIHLALLDTSPERAYGDITRMAADFCGTPIALISLVDTTLQCFKSRVGIDGAETARELAFCAHAGRSIVW